MEWALVLETTSLFVLFSKVNWSKEYEKSNVKVKAVKTKLFLENYEKMGRIDSKESVELYGCKEGSIYSQGSLEATNCEDLTVKAMGKMKMINTKAADVFCVGKAKILDTQVNGTLDCADNSVLINSTVQSLIVHPGIFKRSGMSLSSLARSNAVYLENTIVKGDVTFHVTGKIFACEKSRILGNVLNGIIVRSLKGLSKL